MINLKRHMGAAVNFRSDDCYGEILEKKELKNDVIYSVVVTRGNALVNDKKAVNKESPTITWHHLSRRNNFKKKLLKSEMDETLRLNMLKVISDIQNHKEVKTKKSYEEIIEKKKSIIDKLKGPSGKILKDYLRSSACTNRYDYFSYFWSSSKNKAFPFFTLDSSVDLFPDELTCKKSVLVEIYKKSNAKKHNEKNEDITLILNGIAELDIIKKINVVDIFYQQNISKQTMLGYLSDGFNLSYEFVTKPFISFVEENKIGQLKYASYKDKIKQSQKLEKNALLNRMNDQATSVEIFDLSNQEGIARFLKSYGFN